LATISKSGRCIDRVTFRNLERHVDKSRHDGAGRRALGGQVLGDGVQRFEVFDFSHVEAIAEPRPAVKKDPSEDRLEV
jgi:hypothetical protein